MHTRWRRWTPATVDRSDWLFDALEGFQPPDMAREADQALRDWLLAEALDNFEAITTWLLTHEHRLMAYHTLSAATVELPDGTTARASNVRFLARDRSYPGVVPRVLEHARREALKADTTLLTIDPFDDDVAAIWRSYGFRDSSTNLGDASAPIYRQFADAEVIRFGRRVSRQA